MANNPKYKKAKAGFTLLEILVALFIFTILSVMMMNGLRLVIDIQANTSQKAERLHQLQIFWLLMSRDIEQIVDRPIRNTFGNTEIAFIGTANGFTITHLGLANPDGNVKRSELERVHYFSDGGVAARSVWNVLDQAPGSQPVTRILLKDILELRFQYLADDGRFYAAWPVLTKKTQTLPRAIRVFLAIPHWGRMSQLYVLPTQQNINPSPAA